MHEKPCIHTVTCRYSITSAHLMVRPTFNLHFSTNQGLGAGHFQSPEPEPESRTKERSRSQRAGKKSEPLLRKRAQLPNKEPKGAEI